MPNLQLGWIDFSKEQRNKVLSVINLLSEPGSIDELGIGIIRDAFSNIFFPGTSTIQTRAKYFLLVPYLLTELDREKALNPERMINWLHEQELDLIDVLKQEGEWGVIGETAGRSLRRKPSDIYWNGIRTYGIFKEEKMTIYEYIRLSKLLKEKKKSLKEQGSLNRKDDDQDGDDADAVSGDLSVGFWRLLDFPQHWRESLSIKLTEQEALFLKNRIINAVPNSILGWVLENDKTDIMSYKSFDELEGLQHQFPEHIYLDYQLAKSFADFIYGAHIRYNVILSKGEDDKVNETWEEWHGQIQQHANLNLQHIIDRLNVHNGRLIKFLIDIQAAMAADDIEKLDELIIQREWRLKGDKRSKLLHRSEFVYEGWVGIDKLQYRLRNGKNLLGDIFEGLGEQYAKTNE